MVRRALVAEERLGIASVLAFRDRTRVSTQRSMRASQSLATLIPHGTVEVSSLVLVLHLAESYGGRTRLLERRQHIRILVAHIHRANIGLIITVAPRRD